jgi:enediyne biosynthesis protein E4
MFVAVKAQTSQAMTHSKWRLRAVLLAASLASLRGIVAAEPAPGLEEQPLAARSGPRGATLFSVMPPSQTGVVTENRYADPKMWWEKYQEFTVGAIGTGIAVGDYDGDGRPDLFVASKTEGCRLFRNLGNWKFEDVTAKAGVGAVAGVWTQGVTFADVNNDGCLDIYVCRFGAANLLFINQGDGTFKEEAQKRGLAVNDSSGMAAFCDYDRDGWLDVYIQTNLLDSAAHPNGQRDYLFHNNGDGNFTNVTDRAGIRGESQGHSATWWDYDNDGWPDLYVANDFAVPDVLYRNNRDGTFTNTLDRVVPHTPFSSMGADLGDVNNDGLIDFLVADMAATTHEKDQRGMADSRAGAKSHDDTPASAPQYLRNALYLNTGTGVMQEAAFLAGVDATDWAWSVRFEDLDNDGRLDLHVTNGMVRELHNSDLLARMMIAESPAERVRIMRSSPILAEANLAYRNLGDLRFENVSAAWGLDQKGVSFGAAFGDFDGDGDLDLVFANYQAGVTFLRNDSDSGHRAIFALKGSVSNRFGIGATVRIETDAGVQVRQLVLARGYLSSSEPTVHFGLGADERMKRVTVSWPSGHTQSFTDLPADRRFTITEPSTASPPRGESKPPEARFAEVSGLLNLAIVSSEETVDEVSQQPLLPFRHNRIGPSLAVGDLNGDGRDDVLLGGTAKVPASVVRSETGGRYSASEKLPVSNPAAAAVNDGPVLIFDANGDGANDLLLTKGGVSLPAGAPEYQPRLLFNDGHGGFGAAPEGVLPPLPISVGAAAAADFDRDGHLDLFIGGRVVPGQYPLPPRSALLAHRDGKFVDVTATIAPGLASVGMVTAALWTDVDGDGWLDLLVAVEWGAVKYFHNQQGKSFEDWTEKAGFAAAGAGWWTSLAAADFNGDGKMDYVAGNVGLNTQYHASPEHPALLFSGDFKDGGPPQMLEAYFEGDRVVPWRARKQLSAAVPELRKRFTKNNDYARATLGELVGEPRLAAAQRFAATELRSGVFLSQPDGKFIFEPLPRVAQIAPLQGIVAGDFDGDGWADLYAVQNSSAPIPAVGRFDGGLSQLLRGDGRGHFTPVPSAESGLVVSGDAKALAVLDLNQDGWPDFLITRNNSSTLAFENRPVAGRKFLRVVLRGLSGNAFAVGARITAELADGTKQTSEIQAGSGYASQSTPTRFIGFSEGNPPQKIEVHWPSGTTTTHAISPGEKILTLTAPTP